jgi:hypothetical protein
VSILQFTLVTDGTSDRVLLPILRWLIRQHWQGFVKGEWADLRHFKDGAVDLRNRIRRAVTMYPCDLLCVHRDAESQTREIRVKEIEDAVADLPNPPHVCVIPVRTTEAWLLIDETALRGAAGNPAGHVALDLPAVTFLEDLPDPKGALYNLLRMASELHGRRLEKFRPQEKFHRLGELIRDFSPLRRLEAFKALEAEVRYVMRKLLKETPPS